MVAAIGITVAVLMETPASDEAAAEVATIAVLMEEMMAVLIEEMAPVASGRAV